MQTQNSTGNTRKSIYSASGKVIGWVQENTYRKQVMGSKHFMRTPPGIGNDVASLEAAQKAGAEWCQVLDRETGNVYTASLQTIYSKGIPRSYGKFGDQLILPFSYWSIAKAHDQPVKQMALLAMV